MTKIRSLALNALRILATLMLVNICITIFFAPLPAQAKAADKTGNSAVVIMYHRFGEGKYPATNITMDQFRAHIAELKKEKYTVMKLSDIVAAIKNNTPLPDRAIAITIDDAYKSIYTRAWPLLKEAGFPFTIFVSTEPVDKGYKDFLNWNEIRKMQKSGLVEIGHHMVSHRSLLDMSAEEISNEIKTASTRIKEETGHRPKLFSYPYGEYSLAVLNQLKQSGFDAAFGQHSGAMWAGDNLMALPRFSLNQSSSGLSRFKLVVNTLPLPVTDMIPEERLLAEDERSPAFGFTVDESVGRLDGLNCYVSNGGEPRIEKLGRRIEVRLSSPFRRGRGRINCTIKGAHNRWHWLGTQFVVK